MSALILFIPPPPPAVPEVGATLSLLAIGIVGIVALRRKLKK